MNKDLYLNIQVMKQLSSGTDLFYRKLAWKNDSLHPQILHLCRLIQSKDIHLGTGVKRDLREMGRQIRSQADILYEESIRSHHIGFQRQFHRIHDLIVGKKRIHRNIHFCIPKMGIVQRFTQRFQRKVVCMDTGIVLIQSQIHSIRACVYRCAEHGH